MDYQLTSRRQVLTAVSLGATVALAGCSGDGSDGESDSSPEDGDRPDSETQTEQSTETESTDEQEQKETSTEGAEEDSTNDGEEQFEEFIASNEYGDSDVNTERYWIEFEKPQEQIELPVTDEIKQSAINDLVYVVENGERPEGLGPLNSLYLAIEEESDNPVIAEFYFNEDEWDTSVEPIQNIGNGGFGSPSGESVSVESLRSFFSENVHGYNDVSEDLPQDYLDLIG